MGSIRLRTSRQFTPDQLERSELCLWEATPPGPYWARPTRTPTACPNGAEHWTIRRYVANDLTPTTPLELNWQTAQVECRLR